MVHQFFTLEVQDVLYTGENNTRTCHWYRERLKEVSLEDNMRNVGLIVLGKLQKIVL